MSEEKFQVLYKNTKKEEIVKELYYKCKANNELVYEIERLTISLQAQEELTMNEHIKVEKLRSIIKEVREYIDEHAKWDYSGGTEENHIAEWYDLDITSSMFIGELLEILDKEREVN